MNCQNCGKELEAGQAFCSHCGQDVAAAETSVAATSTNAVLRQMRMAILYIGWDPYRLGKL